LLVSKVLHDKWVNGTDTSDQAGVKGGKCIALHIRTLMETDIQAASSCTYGQLHRQILRTDLCQVICLHHFLFSCLHSSPAPLLLCYRKEKERKKKGTKKKNEKKHLRTL